MNDYVTQLVQKARKASFLLVSLSTAQKNRVLRTMAKTLIEHKAYILKENKRDLAAAQENKLKQSFIDRLALDVKRVTQMSDSLREVARLPDPVNQLIGRNVRPNGMILEKRRVPLGVVLIVYEARPNVTSDCIGLLFKTSNIGILRGGGASLSSNRAIGKVLQQALEANKITYPVFFIVDRPDRNVVDRLLAQEEYIDLVIPRGGETLIRKVVEHSRIPVIKHYKGICHIFVDKSALQRMALKVCVNAKVQRPSVCNAVETILVHRDIASTFLPRLAKELEKYKVIIKGDPQVCRILPGAQKAGAADWSEEYLDLIVAIKIVKDVDEAVLHINTYGSRHTDSILTRNDMNARKFIREVDSACCFVNISTRFSDGYEFGLGAEIGISTDKLHARGPMGLEELTTYKWIAYGEGQIRE
ncbi:MAG: glutamate-5-semialdehyde dehydrogenase [Candidatus Omnitrophica bacterium]|nr:glutamate-5-semialdehyde dehydrogenase [Candidatus Omnitrophota bacterium]